MAFDVTYNFTSQAGAESNWNFEDPRGTGVQPNNTGGRWSWHNAATTSNGAGPDSGQGDAGYVYTEMSASGVNGDVFTMELDVNHDASNQNITFSYYFGYRGDGNTGTIQLQSNENGAGWISRGPAEVLDQQGTALSGTFVWLQKTVDLTGLISGNSTRFRLVITQGTTGTVWHKDVGVDTVRVVGVDASVDGAGLTLATANKLQPLAGTENSSNFIFDKTLQWGAITIALRKDSSVTTGSKSISIGEKFIGIKTSGIISMSNGATVDGLSLDGDLNIIGNDVTTFTDVIVTGSADFSSNGTYTLDGSTFNDVTNSSGGNITLNLLNGATVNTNTGPNITINNAVNLTFDGIVNDSRLFIRTDSGGPLPEGTVLYNDIVSTDPLSIVYNYIGDQPVSYTVRKASTPPFFKTFTGSGTITNSGLSVFVLQLED